MKKIIIIVTVPVVLETWLKGQAKFLSDYFDVEIITSFSPHIDAIEKYEGVKVTTVDFNRKINLFKDLKVLIHLVGLLLIKRPDMVYSLTPKAGLLGMIAAWLAWVPRRVHSVVGLPHLEARGKRKALLLATEKLTYKFTTHLFCNSFNLKTEMQGTLTKKNVEVIGNGSVNGVDSEYFKDTYSKDAKLMLRKEEGIGEHDYVICFVGRIVNDKGINELVNAFVKLYSRYPQIKLLLVGDPEADLDPVSPETLEKIQENQAIFQKSFRDDIRPCLAISDLFVLPSYREGLPNVLIEAGSFGLPLIATNINGCNEIIEDGVNGLLVEKRDEQILANAIEKLINDTSLYKRLQSDVRDSIVKRYAQSFFYEQLLETFQKILKGQ